MRYREIEDLCGYAEAGTHCSVDGAPVAGGVGVFSGEEECVGDGLGHLLWGVEASGGNVTVGSERVRITTPVVGVDANELTLHLCEFETEDLCQRDAGLMG